MVVVVLMFGSIHTDFAAAYVTLNSFSGTPTTLQVSGGGWTSGEAISLYVGNTSGIRVAAATVAGDGFFGPVSITIPPSTPQGPISIIAVASGGQTQSNSYYVIP